MTVVIRILEVDLNKFPRAIINLLIKSHRYLVGVNLFHVPGLPPLPPLHIEPISPSTRGEVFPMGKFPFIQLTRTHQMSIDPEVSKLSSVLIPGLGDISQSLRSEDSVPREWTPNCSGQGALSGGSARHSGLSLLTQPFPPYSALRTKNSGLPSRTQH